MDALIYLGSWVAIVVLIVVSNIKASKKQGEITFDKRSGADIQFNDYDFHNTIDYRRL
ncbi:MAG: hypothetical protein AABY36_08185 [Campylobacterota bacterium]|jgi:hypothetical protein|uniref:hypothetical protein n=1 Tax=Sulfurimonas sp. TaxID=2022749 RepID=UPI0026079E6D|nr:hypothetical protein [Sulfurimonas sp.]MDD3854905.1 hypothetical protein [Sulfurimonas sp.]